MWFHQVVREASGCAAYLVGSTRAGECLVFDPLWDISPYVDIAARKSSRITHVVDSHSHADHVSGARRLAEATGAALLLPRAAKLAYPAERLDPGQRIQIGEVEAEVIAMPGHRPEQINLLLRDRDRGPHPWCLLTADFLMVGDLARPDLAQDGREGAAILFHDAIPKLLALPDFVEVYPGHMAGST